MTPDDPLMRHHLARARVMRLATISGAGRVSLTPIWFTVVGGRLVSTTAATTAAARNIGADPRVTVLLDAQDAGGSEVVVRLRGVAEVRRGLPPPGVLARIALRHYLAPRALRSELSHLRLWRLRRRYYAAGDPVWIAVEPASAELLAVPRAGLAVPPT